MRSREELTHAPKMGLCLSPPTATARRAFSSPLQPATTRRGSCRVPWRAPVVWPMCSTRRTCPRAAGPPLAAEARVPRRGRPALPWVVPPHLNPRTRSRRRAAAFGSGARAFLWLRCDGVSSRSGASAGRRGGPKRLGEAGQALRPSFKSWSGVREPCAAGAPGRAPQSSDELRSPWGLRTGRHGSVHVAPW